MQATKEQVRRVEDIGLSSGAGTQWNDRTYKW